MKISRVRSFLLSFPFPEPLSLPYYGGKRSILKRDAMLIKVEAEGGLIGYGPGPGSELAQERIRTVVAPFLEDRVLADPDALRVQFLEAAGGDTELVNVYMAVEIALHDLLGKALGVPVSELTGGRIRDQIRLYGSAGMYMPPEGYAAEAAGIAALGFTGYKMRPALGPEEDLRTVELMREAVGYGMDLMVDAHSWWRMGDRSYSYDMVEQLAREMGTFDIAWLEEPLPPDDHASYRRLRETGYVPLAAGEHERSEDGFSDLALNGCVDYVQMDLICQGGYSACRRILSEVSRAASRFAFHSWGTDLEVMAAAQIGVCWPETVVEWLEYPVYSTLRLKTMYPFPLATQILRQPLEIKQGHLVVPATPGLGVEVDESVIEKFPWVPGPWSYFQVDSPRETFAVTSDHSIRWTAGEPPPGL